MLTVEIWTLLSGFSCPIPTLPLIAPILLGLGEATHSKSLGMKRVKEVEKATIISRIYSEEKGKTTTTSQNKQTR